MNEKENHSEDSAVPFTDVFIFAPTVFEVNIQAVLRSKRKCGIIIIAQLICVQHELPSTYNDIQQIVHESWLTIYLVQVGKI